MSDSPPPETARQPDQKPFQFTMRAMFIAVTVFAILLGILVPLIRFAHREAMQAQCSNNLKQIALALHNYHDTYRCFPSASIPGADGKPMHSWRAAVLPYLESQPPPFRYRYSEPWDGPNNRKLHTERVGTYHCPADHSDPTMTSYVAVVGPGTAWPGHERTRFRDFRDGTSNCILVVEVADSGIHWMEPRDLELADMKLPINPKSGDGISSRHVGGTLVCLADGSVRFLPNDLAAETLRKLLTINDGEAVSMDDF